MAIARKTLLSWRKEALEVKGFKKTSEPIRTLQYFSNYILDMTQELLDLRLLAEKEKK